MKRETVKKKLSMATLKKKIELEHVFFFYNSRPLLGKGKPLRRNGHSVANSSPQVGFKKYE